MIGCVLDASGPISPEVSSYLHRGAVEMIQRGESTRKLKGKVCEGTLSTEWQSAILGSFAGLKFTAEIECEQGHRSITFIVRTMDELEGWSYAPPGMLEEIARQEAMEERPHRSRLN